MSFEESQPGSEFIALYRSAVNAIPVDADSSWVSFPNSIWIADSKPVVEIDLPCIGADAIDPEILEFRSTDDVPLELRREDHTELWLNFYAYRNGRLWVAEADRDIPVTRDWSRPLYEYVLIVPVEAEPYIMQYRGMHIGVPGHVPRHVPSPQEVLSLSEAITNLKPIYIPKTEHKD